MLKNKVKELRARHNFSQIDLAALTGVTRQTIGFIENPIRQTCHKISSTFTSNRG